MTSTRQLLHRLTLIRLFTSIGAISIITKLKLDVLHFVLLHFFRAVCIVVKRLQTAAISIVYKTDRVEVLRSISFMIISILIVNNFY